jgi:hypothetical protein
VGTLNLFLAGFCSPNYCASEQWKDQEKTAPNRENPGKQQERRVFVDRAELPALGQMGQTTPVNAILAKTLSLFVVPRRGTISLQFLA